MVATHTPTSELARTVRVETPEQVELGFEIADLGSRFLALLLDSLVIFAAFLGLLLLGIWVTARVDVPDPLLGWGGMVMILVSFAVLWGYFTYFEGFHNGRTPGKRGAGLRVIHEGGHPITLRGAAIRNLIRLVDLQPAFSGMVGGVAMMLHPRTQRLGDMAAGTLVVRDRGALELSEEELEGMVGGRRSPPELTDEAYAALQRFVERRGDLAAGARARLVGQLADALADALDRDTPGDRPSEDRLLALYERERDRRGATGADAIGSSPLVAALVRSQGPRWLEYRGLVRRAQKRRLESLSPEEIERFGMLYRLAAADLARARTYGAAGPLLFTLERWVGAGHNLLYRSGGRTWRALVDWLRSGFPRLVRARAGFVLLAAGFLFLPAVGTYVAVTADPALARELLPGGMIARAETASDRAREGGRYVEVPEVFMPVMSSGIIANNVQVTFAAFAGGILAGIGTALLLAFNGVHLGAVVALFHVEGAAGLLWEFVAPHGAIELVAITIAGAAGLILGSGLVVPGRLSRSAALADRARESVSLLAGTTVLLVLAGLVEGFVSPAPIPRATKLVVAAVLGLVVVTYLLLGGRSSRAVTDDPGT
ncbi:MAG: hypothetical protein GWM90_21155 [Gemmatimonadetes bacterium]|nr:hypothetical protein [Gemmatimonadota bacterium]NIQ57034.1 hypothetical protein [Gemmatimonadota bacterium]NIU77206.1 hypothetical protein [Gammaproteobacteria bacterium]NIX46498.1 hypothetical protein [Gemmatimonadota bacterium]NIY10821.1 hypothetical protein [Gemmatimonadota bacterium]